MRTEKNRKNQSFRHAGSDRIRISGSRTDRNTYAQKHAPATNSQIKKLLHKKSTGTKHASILYMPEVRQDVIGGLTGKQKKCWKKLTPGEQVRLLRQVEIPVFKSIKCQELCSYNGNSPKGDYSEYQKAAVNQQIKTVCCPPSVRRAVYTRRTVPFMQKNKPGSYTTAYQRKIPDSKKAYSSQLKKALKKERRRYKAEFARAFNAEFQKIMDKEKAQSAVRTEKTFAELTARSGKSDIRLAALPLTFPLKLQIEKRMASIVAAVGNLVVSAVTTLMPLIALPAAIIGMLSFAAGFFGTLAATWDPAGNGLPDAPYVANTAVQWAEYIAETDTHGYNDGYFSRWGPTDYSNVTFVVTAFDRAGLSLKKDGASSATDLYDACMANGFLDVREEINTYRDLKKGDLLIRKGNSSGEYYLAIYCGNRKMVRALCDENGNQKHGQEGDQTGDEISIVNCSNQNWDHILRYYGDMTLYGGIGRQIAEYAQSFVGRLPYVYGGTSLVTGADCSGFVQSVYAHFGYSLPRTAGAQYAAGRKIGRRVEDWQAGDLIYYSRTGSVQTGGGRAEHIVIYIGNGKVVGESSSTTGCVVYNWNYRSDYVGTARYLPDFDSDMSLTGNDNATRIWNYLRRTLGCSRAAAAGIMGSIYAESGYDPGAVQPNGVGHGICQWSWDRWYGGNGLQQFANRNHRNWNDLALQLAFFKYEIIERNLIGSYYPGGWQKFKALTSVDGDGGSAHVFFYAFEYGSYISYSAFTSAGFEANFACTSNRLGVAMSVYRNRSTYP